MLAIRALVEEGAMVGDGITDALLTITTSVIAYEVAELLAVANGLRARA